MLVLQCDAGTRGVDGATDADQFQLGDALPRVDQVEQHADQHRSHRLGDGQVLQRPRVRQSPRSASQTANELRGRSRAIPPVSTTSFSGFPAQRTRRTISPRNQTTFTGAVPAMSMERTPLASSIRSANCGASRESPLVPLTVDEDCSSSHWPIARTRSAGGITPSPNTPSPHVTATPSHGTSVRTSGGRPA